ncbi:MAG: histidine kinase [Bacteroidota bacterium]
MVSAVVFCQLPNEGAVVQIKGSVKGKENYAPIPGVEVTNGKGAYTVTDVLGEFKIRVAMGDLLIFKSPEFETIRYRIKSDEDVKVLVKGYQSSISRRDASVKQISSFQIFLDSAEFYKKEDIEKSIDFIVQSIAVLGKNGNKGELSRSYTLLGEIYLFHQQYDLAIDNFKYALAKKKSIRTTLLLGQTYVLNKEFVAAENIVSPLLKVKNMVPYQRVALYESLGDANVGMKDGKSALEFYQEGLKIAEKNQISPKVIDLSSKIGDTYAKSDRVQVAEGFYANSLELSAQQTPQRSIQEKEKVADFYNQKNRFADEIQLRKKSLRELEQLPNQTIGDNKGVVASDSITPQRINYKIANAYIAQDKLEEAIPYLQRSIVESGSEDDFVVQKDATRKLSEVYENQGDFSKAIEAYQKYAVVLDSLYIRKEQEISRVARLNREITIKQNRILSLEQERELSQSKYNLALTEQQLFEESNKRQRLIIYSLLFGIILLGLATFFFYRSNKQQKLANNILALRSLRSQMNPHFIFNALNSVNNFIAKSDERSANRFLSDFSVLMRTVLENSEEDFIPLSKELELLELYIKLEHSRFPEKFAYEISIGADVDIAQFHIPPMLLQPYIENAIWHGLRYKETKGFLKIGVNTMDASTIKIEIVDDGIGREKSAALKTKNQQKQKSKGMGNIKKRIAILNEMYKNKVDVAIGNLYKDETGTRVILKLKKV